MALSDGCGSPGTSALGSSWRAAPVPASAAESGQAVLGVTAGARLSPLAGSPSWPAGCSAGTSGCAAASGFSSFPSLSGAAALALSGSPRASASAGVLSSPGTLSAPAREQEKPSSCCCQQNSQIPQNSQKQQFFNCWCCPIGIKLHPGAPGAHRNWVCKVAKELKWVSFVLHKAQVGKS